LLDKTKAKLISHRGNLLGSDKENENNPNYILNSINLGYEVEIDVWFNKKNFYLGHDEPKYPINLSFLQNKKLWCHAKNLNALKYLIDNKICCFWHQKDDYTITSNLFIWTYPNKKITKKSIIVCKTLEETLSYNKSDVYGICSDYVGLLKNKNN
jgi:hypothetical protein